MKAKIIILFIAALLILTAGCQTTAAPTERPPAATPRFADLMEATPQDDQDYPIPVFIVTSFVETRSPEAWVISGVIQQREPVMAGLKFDRLLITFVFQDGRPCEYQVPEHGPLNDLVEPIPFALALDAGNYQSAGFGFTDFQDFEATSRVDKIVVQILTNRNKLEYSPNHWTGTFEAGF